MSKVNNLGIPPITIVTGETFASAQYYFVEARTSGTAMQAWIANSASATYSPIGIMQTEPVSGEVGAVAVMGFSKLVCAATSACPGSWLTCNGSGQGIVTSTGSLACAVAWEVPDSSASSIIEVMLLPGKSDLTSKV